MVNLDPGFASRLPGPDWLRARRQEAAERWAGVPLPSPDEEEWRYSRVGELDPDRFAPLEGTGQPPAGRPAGLQDLLDRLPGDLAGLVLRCNGRLTHAHLDEELQNKGVRFAPVAELEAGPELLGSVIEEPLDVFGGWNQALALDPVGLVVPDGVEVDAPLALVDWIETSGIAMFPRLAVRLGHGAQATVLCWEAGSAGEALTVPVLEADVGPYARLSLLGVQETPEGSWRIAEQAARVAEKGDVTIAEVSVGGSYSRTRTDCELEGRGARGALMAAYFGYGDQMLDFRTFQQHIGPGTESDLLFKGAVAGRSRSVYSGLIHVHPDARGANAFQTNRNLKLGEHSWAESVPNLEIENNDVRCSHASAVGPVDEDQLFYLESRGLPPEVASRLIVIGFFDEVLARLPVPSLAPQVRDMIVRRIDAEGA